MEDIFIPALGMAMEEASLVEWLKDPGDPIAAGDQVAIIETDKAMLELTAATNGVLGAHRFAEGDQVPAGRTVTVVLGPGESEDDSAAAAAGPEGTPAAAGCTDRRATLPSPTTSVGDGQDSPDDEMPGRRGHRPDSPIGAAHASADWPPKRQPVLRAPRSRHQPRRP